MYRVQQLLGGRLSLRNYNAQTYAMIKALNKLARIDMPETCRINKETHETGRLCLYTELRNQTPKYLKIGHFCVSGFTKLDKLEINLLMRITGTQACQNKQEPASYFAIFLF